MSQRRLTNPKMAAITAPEPSGGYKHAYCVGTWYGQAQVYKQGKNMATPVLTIAHFSFVVPK